TDKTMYNQSYSNLSVIPYSGCTILLHILVDQQRTNAMYLLNEEISPTKAEEIGLIYKALPADQLIENTTKICQKLAAMPTKGFGLYKQAINQSLQNNLSKQLELESILQTEAGNTNDYHEGVQAFLEKRQPEFEGK